ncbi:membrane protein [Dictyobacter sp. S3.2.2.5]|uniref:Membrane protein n=1 Tax=Dictyobacter halimunensis TaxID=3026934 RepID=A0ABQ6FKC7_9CHLR|nr:membrane protein [Dictyobacter sp. S3.2.2.5]
MQLAPQIERSVEQGVTAPKKSTRPHIYELDIVRALTAVLVITVHVLFFTKVFSTRLSFLLPQYALLTLAHARAVFAFVTAFALVYVYAGKPFSGRTFWKKRSLGILLPYCFWTCIYVWVNWHPATLEAFTWTSLRSMLLGDASYQLYFILLTIQFYIIFPLFLWFVQKVKNHPWLVLSISFAIQMIVLYVDYSYVQPGGKWNLSGLWSQIASYHDRYIILYEFYFVMGGFAALYQTQIRAFLTRYGKSIIALMVVACAITVLHFYIQIMVGHESYARATNFLQPIVGVYDAVLTIFICYGAYLLASKKRADGKPRGYKGWQLLSNATFGVYLIHALFISLTMNYSYLIPQAWPAQLRVLTLWSTVVVCSYISSIVLMKIPVISRLVGRKQAFPNMSSLFSKELATRESLSKQ